MNLNSRGCETLCRGGPQRPPVRGYQHGPIVIKAAKRLRICVSLLLFLAPAAAQAPDEASPQQSVSRMLLDASRALQAGNAARFLGYFNRSGFGGYPDLEGNVVALTRQAEIASSIDITSAKQEEGAYHVTIDWVLQLTPSGGIGRLEERRAAVTVEVSVSGVKPEIDGLAPVDFFRPPGASKPE
jgi:hypothetical protein